MLKNILTIDWNLNFFLTSSVSVVCGSFSVAGRVIIL